MEKSHAIGARPVLLLARDARVTKKTIYGLALPSQAKGFPNSFAVRCAFDHCFTLRWHSRRSLDNVMVFYRLSVEIREKRSCRPIFIQKHNNEFGK